MEDCVDECLLHVSTACYGIVWDLSHTLSKPAYVVLDMALPFYWRTGYYMRSSQALVAPVIQSYVASQVVTYVL